MHPNFSRWNLRAVAAAGILLCPLTPPSALCAGVTEQILHSFGGGKGGSRPSGGLIADKKGNLYGTTRYGGIGKGFSGAGTVFQIATDGHENVLYAFKAGSDGADPTGTLIMDKNGNLYGTTIYGGGTGCGGYGCGTVFKFAPNGQETVLHAFQGQADGQSPQSGVVEDSNGNLFGTTVLGGNGSKCSQAGCGTLFELQSDGTKITLYDFQGADDGALPVASVILDSAGNLYGTAEEGGSSNCEFGCGTVFKLTPDGTFAVLHEFQGDLDGAYPKAPLIADTAGNFYGTTSAGGGSDIGAGTVFKLTPTGQETVLHAFHEGKDGDSPEAGLVMDKKGDLYGTTTYGGRYRCERAGCGTVFEVNPEGTETVLYSFQKRPQGNRPVAQLLPGAHGEFFGTTAAGGKRSQGVVFELKK